MLSAEYKTEFTASLGARHRGVIGEGGEFEFEHRGNYLKPLLQNLQASL